MMMMTAAELIAKLQGYLGDRDVLVSAWTGDYFQTGPIEECCEIQYEDEIMPVVVLRQEAFDETPPS